MSYYDETNDETSQLPVQKQRTLLDLVFLGFNSRVLALDRETGEIVWEWKSPKGKGSYVAVLVDGDRLMVSVQGYTYCLDLNSGAQIWENHLKGYGLGVPTLVSIHGNSGSAAAAALIAQQQQAAAEGAAGGA